MWDAGTSPVQPFRGHPTSPKEQSNTRSASWAKMPFPICNTSSAQQRQPSPFSDPSQAKRALKYKQKQNKTMNSISHLCSSFSCCPPLRPHMRHSPAAPVPWPSASGPTAALGGTELWPSSCTGNCCLLASLPLQIQPPSFPVLNCRAASLCAVKQLPGATQRGSHFGGGYDKKGSKRSTEPGYNLPLSMAQFGHHHLATLFRTCPKFGYTHPIPFLTALLSIHTEGGGSKGLMGFSFSSQTGTPVSFMGRANGGGGTGRGRRICFMALTGTPIMV